MPDLTTDSLSGIGMTSQRTRDRMVERLRTQGIQNASVLRIMAATPRHLFVDEALATRAYEDTALPIGFGQTLSQPYVVARMTELLLEAGMPTSVLEIGTGSGYQAAVLAQLVPRVYTVERIGALAQRARRLLDGVGFRNIQFKLDDGHMGWLEQGPYEAILLTAAPGEIPESLLQQLTPGGRLLAPVGAGERQHLVMVTREGNIFVHRTLDAVSFVPMRAGHEA
ncbi:protein-L-isoaspartate O-methyltransferase [Acidihalobacter yilgarnensis]|uniref:Protein-L-isoaspartate O-methyltransferase n=1 Tax=Acidihalobacter yilgarnensis TaxID=2819280 RepID=A0A1D8INY8_9GAMM|nr:protein-L-isoaspartate(D-aspartate) O-methyltransferase [Acidihalobacter yilgarnensis]AOU98176.1 protein-L-isoaspartate O-methyltransferase [Acidihalobacter yilgarnensis]